MAVARVISTDSEVGLIGFAGNGTRYPDALVLLNLSQHAKFVNIKILGHPADPSTRTELPTVKSTCH